MQVCKTAVIIAGAGDLPNVQTLREKYVPKLAEERIVEVKSKLKDKYIVIYSDETTDKKGRCVFAVLFRPITPDEIVDIYVAGVHFLEKSDSSTCSRAILDSMVKYEIKYEQILGLISDSAPYMTKCIDTLKVILGEHVIHVQCWAHKLNLIGNIWIKELNQLNDAVIKMKSAFLNTRKRKHLYQHYLLEKYPNQEKCVKFFPIPVMTRWNSWFNSVLYLADYLDDAIQFFKTDDMTRYNNAGIDYFSSLPDLQINSIKAQAQFVKDHSIDLIKMIEHLEGTKYPTSHTLYSQLNKLKNSFSAVAKGCFFEKTNEEIKKSVKLSEKNTINTLLKRVGSLSFDKLNTLMANDPSNIHFTALEKVLNPTKILLNEVNDNLVLNLKKIHSFENLESKDLISGYGGLKDLIKENSNNENIDIIKILCALKIDFPRFANSALMAIWLPCSNVDSERFLSQYNTVLTDRRHNLSEKNLETMTIFYFE